MQNTPEDPLENSHKSAHGKFDSAHEVHESVLGQFSHVIFSFVLFLGYFWNSHVSPGWDSWTAHFEQFWFSVRTGPPGSFGDLFLLKGFSRQSLEKKHFFVPGAPTKIKGLCLLSRAEAFQLATVPGASPYPGSWLSHELGEVVRNLFEAQGCADFLLRNFW